MADLYIVNETTDSQLQLIVVKGDTFRYQERIKTINPKPIKFSNHYNGWVFRKEDEETVRNYLSDLLEPDVNDTVNAENKIKHMNKSDLKSALALALEKAKNEFKEEEEQNNVSRRAVSNTVVTRPQHIEPSDNQTVGNNGDGLRDGNIRPLDARVGNDLPATRNRREAATVIKETNSQGNRDSSGQSTRPIIEPLDSFRGASGERGEPRPLEPRVRSGVPDRGSVNPLEPLKPIEVAQPKEAISPLKPLLKESNPPATINPLEPLITDFPVRAEVDVTIIESIPTDSSYIHAEVTKSALSALNTLSLQASSIGYNIGELLDIPLSIAPVHISQIANNYNSLLSQLETHNESMKAINQGFMNADPRLAYSSYLAIFDIAHPEMDQDALEQFATIHFPELIESLATGPDVSEADRILSRYDHIGENIYAQKVHILYDNNHRIITDNEIVVAESDNIKKITDTFKISTILPLKENEVSLKDAIRLHEDNTSFYTDEEHKILFTLLTVEQEKLSKEEVELESAREIVALDLAERVKDKQQPNTEPDLLEGDIAIQRIADATNNNIEKISKDLEVQRKKIGLFPNNVNQDIYNTQEKLIDKLEKQLVEQIAFQENAQSSLVASEINTRLKDEILKENSWIQENNDGYLDALAESYKDIRPDEEEQELDEPSLIKASQEETEPTPTYDTNTQDEPLQVEEIAIEPPVSNARYGVEKLAESLSRLNTSQEKINTEKDRATVLEASLSDDLDAREKEDNQTLYEEQQILIGELQESHDELVTTNELIIDSFNKANKQVENILNNNEHAEDIFNNAKKKLSALSGKHNDAEVSEIGFYFGLEPALEKGINSLRPSEATLSAIDNDAIHIGGIKSFEAGHFAGQMTGKDFLLHNPDYVPNSQKENAVEPIDAIETVEAVETVEPVVVAPVEEPEEARISMSIIKNYHAKRDSDVYVLKLNAKVERVIFDKINRLSKENKGWYSRFKKNGAIPGFQFTDLSAALKIVDELGVLSNENRAEVDAQFKTESVVTSEVEDVIEPVDVTTQATDEDTFTEQDLEILGFKTEDELKAKLKEDFEASKAENRSLDDIIKNGKLQGYNYLGENISDESVFEDKNRIRHVLQGSFYVGESVNISLALSSGRGLGPKPLDLQKDEHLTKQEYDRVNLVLEDTTPLEPVTVETTKEATSKDYPALNINGQYDDEQAKLIRATYYTTEVEISTLEIAENNYISAIEMNSENVNLHTLLDGNAAIYSTPEAATNDMVAKLNSTDLPDFEKRYLVSRLETGKPSLEERIAGQEWSHIETPEGFVLTKNDIQKGVPLTDIDEVEKIEQFQNNKSLTDWPKASRNGVYDLEKATSITSHIGNVSATLNILQTGPETFIHLYSSKGDDWARPLNLNDVASESITEEVSFKQALGNLYRDDYLTDIQADKLTQGLTKEYQKIFVTPLTEFTTNVEVQETKKEETNVDQLIKNSIEYIKKTTPRVDEFLANSKNAEEYIYDNKQEIAENGFYAGFCYQYTQNNNIEESGLFTSYDLISLPDGSRAFADAFSAGQVQANVYEDNLLEEEEQAKKNDRSLVKPNEHGVYSDDDAVVIRYEKKPNDITISIIELKDHFLFANRLITLNAGRTSGLSVDGTRFETAKDALFASLDDIVSYGEMTLSRNQLTALEKSIKLQFNKAYGEFPAFDLNAISQRYKDEQIISGSLLSNHESSPNGQFEFGLGNSDVIESDNNAASSRPIIDDGIDEKTPMVDVPVERFKKKNYVIPEEQELGGTPKVRFVANIEAIKLLLSLETENALATSKEQAILSQYSGFGGITQVFDEDNDSWANEFQELANLLSETEYEHARASILDSYYTPKDIVKSAWQGIKQMGFDRGLISEPSIGVGNFIGYGPEKTIANSIIHGVELDQITGRIAKQLYQKGLISVGTGYEDVDIPDNHYDLVLGNPPFGSTKVIGRSMSAGNNRSIHEYFLIKSAEKLRPGGVMVQVVTHSFLDSKSNKARKAMASEVDLEAVIRLPSETFKGTTGTKIVTDLIFFRKPLANEIRKDIDWIDTIKYGKDKSMFIDPTLPEEVRLKLDKIEDADNIFVLNEVFSREKGHILGELGKTSGQYNSEVLTVNLADEELTTALSNIIKSIVPENIYLKTDSLTFNNNNESANIEIPETVKINEFFVVKGSDSVIAQKKSDYIDEKQYQIIEAANKTQHKRIIGQIKIRDIARDILAKEKQDLENQDFLSERNELNVEYDAFVKKYGFINSTANRKAFNQDPSLYLLSSLEKEYSKGISAAVAKKNKVEPKKPTATKSDIFRKRVTPQTYKEPKQADSVIDALYITLNAVGYPSIEKIQNLTADKNGNTIDEDEIVSQLEGKIFYNPETKDYELDDLYLSGSVKEKLALAQSLLHDQPRLATNVKHLIKAQPKDLQFKEIKGIEINSNWVPKSLLNDFVSSVFDAKTELVYLNTATSPWAINIQEGVNHTRMHSEWGTRRRSAKDIVYAMLNNRQLIVKDKIDGRTFVNQPETDLVNAQVNKIQSYFKNYISETKERRDFLTKEYNEKINTHVRYDTNGDHLILPGINQSKTLRKNQKDVVWKAIQTKQILMDHCVGSGKTYATIAAVMELKRLGFAKKMIITVPNEVLGAWRTAFLELYPTANILCAETTDFQKANRKRLFNLIATNNWDAVIVPASSFGLIPLPVKTETKIIRQMINDLTTALNTEKSNGGDSFTIRQLEAAKKTQLKKANQLTLKQNNKDASVDFDMLGIDGLAIDEVHIPGKNLARESNLKNVKGLGNPDGCGKSHQIYVLTHFLRDKYSNNAPLIFATGTPISNSLSEMHTYMRYMMYDELKQKGLLSFDQFAATFIAIETNYQVTPTGQYKQETWLAKLKNLPELMALYGTFCDSITVNDINKENARLGLPNIAPKMKGGKMDLILAQQSPMQSAYFGEAIFTYDEDDSVAFKMDNATLSKLELNEVAVYADEDTLEADPTTKYQFNLSDDGPLHCQDLDITDIYESKEHAINRVQNLYNTPVLEFTENSLKDQFKYLPDLMRSTGGKINALSLTTKAILAALDFRIIDGTAEDYEFSKTNLLINELMPIYDEFKDDKGVQLIFCDRSVPLKEKNNVFIPIYHRDVLGELQKEDGRPIDDIKQFNDIENVNIAVIASTSTDLQSGKKSNTFTLMETNSGIVLQEGKLQKHTINKFKERLESDPTLVEGILKNFKDNTSQYGGAISDDQIEDYRVELDFKELEEDYLKEEVYQSIKSGFSVYEDICSKLVLKGIPREEIAFIHDIDGKTKEQKEQFEKDINDGKIRVVIGSTGKLGTGRNIQKRIVAMHHLDFNWRPDALTQRNGRGMRFGNMFFEHDDTFEVIVKAYATEATGDSRMIQIVLNKQKGIDSLRQFDKDKREVEEIVSDQLSFEDMTAVTSGNPLIKEEMELKKKLKDTQVELVQLEHTVYSLDNDYALATKADDVYEKLQAEFKPWVDHIYAHPAKEEYMKTNKRNNSSSLETRNVAAYTKDGTKLTKGEFHSDLVDTMKTSMRENKTDKEPLYVCDYRGVELYTVFHNSNDSALLYLHNKELSQQYYYITSYEGKDTISPAGLMVKMNNVLEKMSHKVSTAEMVRDSHLEKLPGLEKKVAQVKEEKAQKSADVLTAKNKHYKVSNKLEKEGGLIPLSPEMTLQKEALIKIRKDAIEDWKTDVYLNVNKEINETLKATVEPVTTQNEPKNSAAFSPG